MKKQTIVLAFIAMLVLGLACSLPSAGPAPSATPPPEPTPTETPLPPPTSPPTPFEGGECEAPSTRIDANTVYEEQMHSTTDPYPANCLYYCLWIPENQGDLEIGISNLSVDLDLYVGYGSMEAISGGQIVAGETYTWKSNEFGTADEDVLIPSPEGGVYYIEVCSYEGAASPFGLSTTLR